MLEVSLETFNRFSSLRREVPSSLLKGLAERAGPAATGEDAGPAGTAEARDGSAWWAEAGCTTGPNTGSDGSNGVGEGAGAG